MDWNRFGDGRSCKICKLEVGRKSTGVQLGGNGIGECGGLVWPMQRASSLILSHPARHLWISHSLFQGS